VSVFMSIMSMAANNSCCSERGYTGVGTLSVKTNSHVGLDTEMKHFNEDVFEHLECTE